MSITSTSNNHYIRVVYDLNILKPIMKLACFDLDGTLITTKSGKKFPKDKDDWKLKYSGAYGVIKTLKNLILSGYQIVIFTNHKGISKGKTSYPDVFHKIEQIETTVGKQFFIGISTKDDYYRKPLTGMWDKMHYNLCENDTMRVKIDMDLSFYCGDAAGRTNDFSNSDLNFAHNTGLKFYLPEEVFHDLYYNHPHGIFEEMAENNYQRPTMQTGYEPDWEDKLRTIASNPVDNPFNKQYAGTKGHFLVVMMGPPASGKSTCWMKRLFISHKLKIVSRDILKTPARCLKAFKGYLEAEENIVVDNTHPTVESRKVWLDIALVKGGYTCVLIEMQTPEWLVKHQNKLRVQMSKGGKKLIPPVAYGVFKKKYQKPTLEEGWDSILEFKLEHTIRKDMLTKEFFQRF